MKVLISGWTEGFVGPHLAEYIKNQGHDPYPLDLSGKWVDLRNAELVDQVVKQVRPGIVFHLAALSSVGKAWKDPAPVFEVNVNGTKNLLEALKKHAPDASVLFVSTGAVYGKAGDPPKIFREDDGFDPQNPYAESKAKAEMLCVEYAKKYSLDIRRVRPQGHTGPGQRLGFVVPDIASQAAAVALKKALPVIKVGNLDVKREFADVRDVVRAYWTVMEKGEPGRAYNLATNRPRSIKEVAQTLIKAAGIEVELVQESARVRKSDESSPTLDTQSIKSLGFDFQIPFEKTMADVLHEWLEKTGTEK